jgi:hypothetical protein
LSFVYPSGRTLAFDANFYQSVYADIALTLGNYLRDRHQTGDAESVVEIADMTIHKALVAKPNEAKLLRASVAVDWEAGSAMCRFLSMDVSLHSFS